MIKDKLSKIVNLTEENEEYAYEAIVEDNAHKVDKDILKEMLNVDDETMPGWIAQNLRGRLAASLGYKAAEMRDEHGTTYLILSGVEIKLIKE